MMVFSFTHDCTHTHSHGISWCNTQYVHCPAWNQDYRALNQCTVLFRFCKIWQCMLSAPGFICHASDTCSHCNQWCEQDHRARDQAIQDQDWDQQHVFGLESSLQAKITVSRPEHIPEYNLNNNLGEMGNYAWIYLRLLGYYLLELIEADL